MVGVLLDACVPTARLVAARTLDRLHLYRSLRGLLQSTAPTATQAEARAVQDACTKQRIATAWHRGIARFAEPLDPVEAPSLPAPAPRHDPAAGTVTARLTSALDRIAHLVQESQAPLLLVPPPVNLRHPPEHPLGAPSSTAAQAAAVDAALARAKSVPELTAALRLDPHRADTLHAWGLARIAEGATEPAHRALTAAVDHDYSARRPTTAVLQTMWSACDRWPDTHCVPLSQSLARNHGKLLPEHLFADHCHPSIAGAKDIAEVIARAIVEQLDAAHL